MKINFILAAVFLFAMLRLQAQDSSSIRYPFQFNTGMGIPQYGITVYIGGDCFVNNEISIGGEIIGNMLLVMGISGNVNYHFGRMLKIPSRFDVCAGLNADTYGTGLEDKLGGPPKIEHNLFGAQLGCKYYLPDDLTAFYLEFEAANYFCYNQVALVQVGLSFRFRIPKLFPIFPDINNM